MPGVEEFGEADGDADHRVIVSAIGLRGDGADLPFSGYDGCMDEKPATSAGQDEENGGTAGREATDGPRASIGLASAGMVALFAIVARLAHLAWIGHARWWGVLQGDAEAYYEWASRIIAGEWLGGEGFYQAPLYPYSLAIIRSVLGDGIGPIAIVQCLASVVSAILIAATAGRFWGRRVGLLAGVMLALYPAGIFFDGLVQKTSFGCLATCGLVAAVGWAVFDNRRRAVLAVGAMSGLVVLLREQAFVWIPLLGVWTWVRQPNPESGHRWSRVGFYILGVALILGPIGVRNRIVAKEWSFSTFQAGPNFYIGNHAGADGRYRPLVRGHESPEFERQDARMLAEEDIGHALSGREVSSYWMRRAFEDIAADPARWIALLGLKTAMVWNRYEVPDVESQYVVADFSPILKALGYTWHFGILCPLAAVGIVATRRDWRRLWVFYGMMAALAGAIIITYVLARYRYPLVPLLIPFAAAGLNDLYLCFRKRRGDVPAARVALLGVVALLTNVRVHDEARLNALSYMNLGVATARSGDLPAATDYFRQAVAGHPSSAEANNNLAQALALQGQFAEAVGRYEAALGSDPSLMGVEYNLGVALESLGGVNDALIHYRNALRLDPSDSDAEAAIKRLTN
ncbi:MAG: glycosyltransferase family 39 protein [Planctomycetes bacterium]|nr:glycosyltransferase family 39 protein [Planctomycetota bacterium]